jgi:cbb3-type cytochrome oxidase subunit 3
VSRHLIVLVMLSLAGIGWLARTGSRGAETPSLDGLVPAVLLVLLAALFDAYRAQQKTRFARERARGEMVMALRAAREVNEPLALIIANLELTVSRMHPGSETFAALHPARDAAWHILDRLRRLTEVPDLPGDETVVLPSLLQAVEGRSIPSVDEPASPFRLVVATATGPRAA